MEINTKISAIMGKNTDWFGEPSLLNELLMKASDNIHGGVRLYFDGDNFVPPPAKCYITYWPFVKINGCGDTLNEAVCRAILAMDRHKNKPKGEQ